MNDLLPHKHGDEGNGSTHFACREMMEKYKGNPGCCGCNMHDCNNELPMKTRKEIIIEEAVKELWDIAGNSAGISLKAAKKLESFLRSQLEKVWAEAEKQAEETRGNIES